MSRVFLIMCLIRLFRYYLMAQRLTVSNWLIDRFLITSFYQSNDEPGSRLRLYYRYTQLVGCNHGVYALLSAGYRYD